MPGENVLHTAFKYVDDLWDDAEAAKLDPLGRLVYRSNQLGSDQRITNTGGGNTSAKLSETDPLTKQPVPVLWVKGSGGDLRTSTRANFSSASQDKLFALQKFYASFPTAQHVDQTQPNAVIAVAASANSVKLTAEIFGSEVIHIPWQRPGFELGLAMQDICRKHPQARGILMGQHGLINWANDDRGCYHLPLGLIEKAAQYIETRYAQKGGDAAAFGGQLHPALPGELRHKILARLLPWLRGQVSRNKRLVATIQEDEKVLRFINSKDAGRLAELGTSCPDHFLRTKIKPLYVALAPGDFSPVNEAAPDEAAIAAYLAP